MAFFEAENVESTALKKVQTVKLVRSSSGVVGEIFTTKVTGPLAGYEWTLFPRISVSRWTWESWSWRRKTLWCRKCVGSAIQEGGVCQLTKRNTAATFGMVSEGSWWKKKNECFVEDRHLTISLSLWEMKCRAWGKNVYGSWPWLVKYHGSQIHAQQWTEQKV